jgi:hypothetical protein
MVGSALASIAVRRHSVAAFGGSKRGVIWQMTKGVRRGSDPGEIIASNFDFFVF